MHTNMHTTQASRPPANGGGVPGAHATGDVVPDAHATLVRKYQAAVKLYGWDRPDVSHASPPSPPLYPDIRPIRRLCYQFNHDKPL